MKKKLSKQITLGINPENGKRIRKRIYASSTTELNKKEKDAVAEFTKQGITSSMSVKAYTDRFFQAYCTTLAPNTQNGYKTAIRKLEPIYYIPMAKITHTDLQEIITQNKDHPWVCSKMCTAYKTIWESAVLDGVVSKNIAYNFKHPKKVAAEKRAFTEAELKAIKSAPFTPIEQLMVNILLQFGLRPGEAFALDRTSIDEKNLTLTINKSLTHVGQTPLIKSTKTCATRILPIPKTFLPKLKPVNKTVYLFANPDGSLYTKKQVFCFCKRILQKINLKMGGTKTIKATEMTFYYFRHNKASLLIYTDVSIVAKAKYLGNSPEVFLSTYAHLIEQKENFDKLSEEVI